ncbi:protein NLP7-like [Camellia sinensis]|uniref:protein NLP7-like n=1 Tax=Camellia sinensis TaxID=4442 RepID=UPI0010359DE4|nr:protein NLP7-like [Camellia sinensis]
MAEIGFFLRTENRTDDDDDMIRDFPHDFKSYVKNHQLLCQRGDYNIGWVFSSCERLPPPPPFSGNLQNHTDIIDETLIAAYPQFIDALKNLFREIILKSAAQVLVQFWKVIEIGGKRLLTIQHQPFSLSYIDEGLCLYRLMSLDNECYVDGESEEDLGLLNRVFRHQQEESTPNVRYYSCKEYPQRDHAIVCNIWGSRAIPLFEPSRQDCVGVLEIVTTIEVSKFFYLLELSVYVKGGGLRSSKCDHLYYEKDNVETPKDIKKMLEMVCSTHYLPLAQTWVLCRLCNVVSRNCTTYHREKDKFHFLHTCSLHNLQKGQGVVGRAVLSQNLVFCKDITQFSITQYPLAHYAREHGLKGCFAICMRSSYTGDNVYVLEFFLPPNYTKGGDPRIALVPLLTTMKKDCKSLKVASGEELGEKLSIEVLDFSEDGKLYSFQIPQTARSPIRMENGEEMVFLDLSDQQLPKVDAIDTRNNVVSNSEENNIVVTSSHQQCIINSSQRPQRKAGIPISLEDLQQHFGMKLDDAAKSLGISRSTVKRACREYNITWWSPRKRSKDNHLLSNKLVQAAVQEQIGEPSQPPISDPPRKQDVATASRPKPRFTVAQDTSVATIKAKYGDDFIRFQLPVLSGMIEFQQQVAKRLNLKGGTYRVKYQDEDNDWILIACDEDLQNYICNSISQGRNTVTMLLQSITNCPP